MNTFVLNNQTVDVFNDGTVKCYTNSILDQNLSKAIKEFLSGVKGNKVTLVFDSLEVLDRYFEIVNNINSSSFRKLNARSSTFRVMREYLTVTDKPCCLYTTNKMLQCDSGTEYAIEHGYKTIKISNVKGNRI